ncbi:MAG: DNA polymerase III subunit beta [Candidatus Limnocylindrales bacterium]
MHTRRAGSPQADEPPMSVGARARSAGHQQEPHHEDDCEMRRYERPIYISQGARSLVKLSLMQENLARGLSLVSRAVSSRATLPVLANVLLKTQDGGLRLTATNLEIGISVWVPGKIENEGTMTVPARLITDVVGGLPTGERVDLEMEGEDTLLMNAGSYKTRLRGIDAEEFPVIPAAGDQPTTQVSQKALRRALSEVTFAAAADETRPILTGVLTQFSEKTLTLAAADNYRIAVKTLELMNPVDDTSVVIPARSFTELMRVLGDTDDPVDIILAQAKSQVIFKVDTTEVVSRLIDGQFPNYQSVLPTSHSTRALVDRDELLQAVRLTALIASSSANVVRLGFGEEEHPGSVSVNAKADIGDAEGQVEAQLEGDPVTIAFNARYMVEALQNMEAEQLAVELSGPLAPGVLKPVDDPAYVHVIMPVRTPS